MKKELKEKIDTLDLKIFTDLRDLSGEFGDEVSLVN